MLYRSSRRTILTATLAGTALAALGVRPGSGIARVQATPEYELIDLGLFGFFVNAPVNQMAIGSGRITGINSDGTTCGSLGVSAERRSPATWSAAGKLKRLKSGKFGGEAMAINDTGDVVGREYVNTLFVLPVAWLGGERILLPLPNGIVSGMASDINDDGVIVGTVTSSDRLTSAIRWVDGEPELLPDMGGLHASSAVRINSNGAIVVAVSTPDGVESGAVLWDGEESLPISLPDRTVEEGEMSRFTDLSNEDLVLLSISRFDDQGAYVAESYVIDGDDATRIEAGQDDGQVTANGMNNLGIVVGDEERVVDGSPVALAFRWEGGELIDLNELIPEDAGLTLVSASAINDAGMICGVALDADAMPHGFLLTPAT